MIVYNNTVFISFVQLNPQSGTGKKISASLAPGSNSVVQLDGDHSYLATASINGNYSNTLSLDAAEDHAVAISLSDGNVHFNRCAEQCPAIVI